MQHNIREVSHFNEERTVRIMDVYVNFLPTRGENPYARQGETIRNSL